MTYAAALRAHLMASPIVVGLVAGRIFPVAVPPPGVGQGWPGDCLTFSMLSAEASSGMNQSRLDQREWEVAAVSEDYERAHEIADAVAAELDYFAGWMGGDLGVRVISCRRQSMVDAHDFEFGLYAVVQVFDLRYLRAT